MMELKFAQPTIKNDNKSEFLINSSDKKNAVSTPTGKKDFKKVFDESKTKSSEDIIKSSKNTLKNNGVVKETSEIAVVEKPTFEKRSMEEELSKEEKEKVEKSVRLLLAFFEKLFPEQKLDVEELPAEEQEVLEKVAGANEEEQLTQVLSKELGITVEKAQELLASIKDLSGKLELSVAPENSAQMMTSEKISSMVAEAVLSNKQGLTTMSKITPEKQESVMISEVVKSTATNTEEIVPMVDVKEVSMSNNPQIIGAEIAVKSDGIAVKNDLEMAMQSNIAPKQPTEPTLKSLQDLVEKTAELVDAVAISTAPQIEKLSREQMLALQSHANFIVGKLNSDAVAKNQSKAGDKGEDTVDNIITAKTSFTTATMNMMPLQAKTEQPFSDLPNNDKSHLPTKSINSLQDANQVKPNYADLLFSNKSNDVENVELNLLQDRAAITRQIVDNIKVMQRNNNTEMVIRLKPEHMGEMILRISTNASGTISASFQTNNPEARLALESTMLALKQELAANGLKVQDVDLFGGISDFLSGQSQANKDQKSNHSNKSFAEKEEKIESVTDNLGEQELTTDDGNVDYRI